MSGQRRRVCQGPPVFCPSSGWMLWVTPWRHEWHAHQMFRGHRTRRENQEAPPRVWIQRDLEGLEEWLQIEETQRRVKSKTLHYIQVGGPDSRRPPTVGLVWADEQCDVSPSTVLPNPVKTPYHLEAYWHKTAGPISRVSDSAALHWSWRGHVLMRSQMTLRKYCSRRNTLLRSGNMAVISWSMEAILHFILSVRSKARRTKRILATRYCWGPWRTEEHMEKRKTSGM